MGRQPTRWLLCGLMTVSAMLSACGGGGDDAESTNVLTVEQGVARVPAGTYTLDMSDAAAAPARITTAGQQVEGLTPEHADFDSFILFRVDDPGKFVIFFYPGMDTAGTTTYACHSASWSLSELQAIDAAPEIDLDLGAMGGTLPVCPSNVEIDANAHRIRIRQLALQRVSSPSESIVISATLQYSLP